MKMRLHFTCKFKIHNESTPQPFYLQQLTVVKQTKNVVLYNLLSIENYFILIKQSILNVYKNIHKKKYIVI